MNFPHFSAAVVLTCGLAATYTFAAEQNKTESKSIGADVHAKDQSITRQIRKAIAEDVALSNGGNNVGVTTTDGMVLLRGTVTSDFIKSVVEKHAITAAGAIDKVTSELKVVERK